MAESKIQGALKDFETEGMGEKAKSTRGRIGETAMNVNEMEQS